ncbi:MAG: histidine phosphatase family protein [Nitrososphaerales archaeon]
MIQLSVMELFIIRHGQSTNNALPDQSDRVVDPPLTELGLRQAELVAKHLANGIDHETQAIEGQPADAPLNGMRISRLYCSAMLRALQTAQIVGAALGLQPHVWVDIHEEGGIWLDHGEPAGICGYPGMTRAEIAKQFPECVLPDELAEEGWWRYGREEWTPFLERAARVAAALRQQAACDERIALVTHGGFSAYLLRALVNAPMDANVFFHHENTGVTRVRFRADGRVSIRYQNRVDHLPADLVT